MNAAVDDFPEEAIEDGEEHGKVLPCGEDPVLVGVEGEDAALKPTIMVGGRGLVFLEDDFEDNDGGGLDGYEDREVDRVVAPWFPVCYCGVFFGSRLDIGC